MIEIVCVVSVVPPKEEGLLLSLIVLVKDRLLFILHQTLMEVIEELSRINGRQKIVFSLEMDLVLLKSNLRNLCGI